MKYLFLIAISFIASTQSTIADSASMLRERIDGIDRVTAYFTQVVQDESGRIVEESTGKLFLAKPNFRWEIEDPFPQVVIAKGNEVEIYDPDLEQLTQKTIGNSIEEAPLTVLTNDELELAAHFEIDALAPIESGTDRYLLTPKSEESLFATLELVFDGSGLASFVLIDHTGQSTLVEFSDFALDQVIQSDLFDLDVPPGTDVVRG